MPAPASSRPRVEAIRHRLVEDPLLQSHERVLRRRLAAVLKRRRALLRLAPSLPQFASAHERFGVLRGDDCWTVREWLPNATAVYLKGPFSQWRASEAFALTRGDDGVFELTLPRDALRHGDAFRLEVHWPGGKGDRMPAFVHRVLQHDDNWDAQVWQPEDQYRWQHPRAERHDDPLLIYEAHVGMAQDAQRVGTFDEFRTEVLPRIRDAGYDAVQLMGLAEHPYYGSFGYQVTSYFAVSSRFGTPEQLMQLVDEAHGMGLCVLMDLVHSHCARNQVEGIARQDGTDAQYTHAGERGRHAAWGSSCFDFGKPRVLEFLLSNCRFWLDRFRVDGFRFDGVTSMLYTHHGLNRTFVSYGDYFGDAVDEDAWIYLALANELIHAVQPGAITIAEDVSGMPGLAAPIDAGGAGFDYRFAMGIADQWIRLVKDVPDEQWSMQKLWYELTIRRRDEKSISYAESHDQAMVGDQTLIHRLLGDRIYDGMSILQQDLRVDRGIALHKLIRLLTLGTAGHGYLNFMGNEFGHPEWIDFPREGNEFSHAFARRQWSLRNDELLRYRHLAAFDRALLQLACDHDLPGHDDEFLLLSDEAGHVLAWLRMDLVFVVNLHPERSFPGLRVPAAAGTYRVVLDSDRSEFGGHDRQDHTVAHRTSPDRIGRHFLQLYVPARTALVLCTRPADGGPEQQSARASS